MAMAIEKVYLDPNAAAYTDDEIVGKVNTAAANITSDGCIEGLAASALDSDDIGEGAANKYDTGVPPSDLDGLPDGATRKAMSDTEKTKLTGIEDEATADQLDTEIRDAIVGIADDDRQIIVSRPTTGQKRIYAIQTHSNGKQEIEQNDTPES